MSAGLRPACCSARCSCWGVVRLAGSNPMSMASSGPGSRDTAARAPTGDNERAGFPVVRYIDVNDSEEVLRAIHLTDSDVPLDLVLHTPGGLVLAATQIARAVLRHKSKVTVFVPHYAMSGGTLIALAADEIVMCEHAVLGPVDPELGERPAASILRAVHQKPIADVDDARSRVSDLQLRKSLRSAWYTARLGSRSEKGSQTSSRASWSANRFRTV
jgi:Serine dehydrogenase proteinase